MTVYDFSWFGSFMAINGLLVLALAINVSRLRIRKRISNGDGNDNEVKKAIRAHANAVEYVPVYGLLLLALVLLQVSWLWQGGAGIDVYRCSSDTCTWHACP